MRKLITTFALFTHPLPRCYDEPRRQPWHAQNLDAVPPSRGLVLCAPWRLHSVATDEVAVELAEARVHVIPE